MVFYNTESENIPTECELKSRCNFLLRFANHHKVDSSNFIQLYCNDWMKSEDCSRKEHIMESDCGCQPVDNLCPDGSYL